MNYCYNDYLKLTKEYLRSLNYYREAEKNLSGEIEDIGRELDGVSIRSANAGSEVHGGGSELNGVEREAETRMHLENQYAELLMERSQLQKQIGKLERAIGTLPQDEKEAVELFFCNRMSYADISVTMSYSERTCRRHVSNATKSIAFMLFGDRANRRVEFIQ